MNRLTWVLPCIGIFGCATLPTDYSELTGDQFLRAIANNNKPLIMPATYKSAAYTDGTSMLATSYNDVGSYPSGRSLSYLEEGKKLCEDRSRSVLSQEAVWGRSVVVCGDPTSVDFVLFDFESRGPAGSDTGERYAFYDHAAIFEIEGLLNAEKVAWISVQYLEFEGETVTKTADSKHRHLSAPELMKLLAKYAE